jgi:hypothetical protein
VKKRLVTIVHAGRERGTPLRLCCPFSAVLLCPYRIVPTSSPLISREPPTAVNNNGPDHVTSSRRHWKFVAFIDDAPDKATAIVRVIEAYDIPENLRGRLMAQPRD